MPDEKLNYISVDVSEKRFESDIESAFLSEGYRKISRNEYDAESMLFPDILIEFISTSQPKEWQRYTKLYDANAKEKLIRRLNDSIYSRGLLDVLKNGLEDLGIHLNLCFFKPESGLNDVLEKNYESNIIGITRQFPYSTKNSNTIDTVLSINGIPVFAFELKNQLKGQDYQCAIEQWKHDRNRKIPFSVSTRDSSLTLPSTSMRSGWQRSSREMQQDSSRSTREATGPETPAEKETPRIRMDTSLPICGRESFPRIPCSTS